MYKYKVTVFTPAYNRGYIIENLYKSLKNQTCRNFQWVVIDDGSSDNTEELFNKWSKEKNNFEILYEKVNNGGKHRAINRGLELAQGEMFFIVDSDDYLVENAIEKIVFYESTIKSKGKFAGVAFNRGYSKNEVIGGTFKGNFIDGTTLEREKYNIIGDKAEVFYTNILVNYIFPSFQGENFLTERVVWDKIGYDGYKLRWVNEIIYICNYLEDGLSKSVRNLFIKNPKGYAYDIKSQILYRNIRGKDKMALYYSYYEMTKENLTNDEMAANLEVNKFALITIVYIWKLKETIKGNGK